MQRDDDLEAIQERDRQTSVSLAIPDHESETNIWEEKDLAIAELKERLTIIQDRLGLPDRC